MYQSVPLVEYATASDFVRATNDLLRRRGVELPLPDRPPVDRERPAADAPLERYEAGYLHDVLGRRGLDLADRALVTLTFLVALGIGGGQLEQQVRVALGHDREVLLAVLLALVPAIGLLRVREAWPVVDAATR